MAGVITQRLSETLKKGGLASFCLTTGSTHFFLAQDVVSDMQV